MDAGGLPLVDNFRPVQPLNGRTVVRRMGVVVRDGKNGDDWTGGGRVVNASMAVMLVALILVGMH